MGRARAAFESSANCPRDFGEGGCKSARRANCDLYIYREEIIWVLFCWCFGMHYDVTNI